MPTSNDGKASPGSPFRLPPARIWNNMVDAGQAWSDGRLSSNAPPPNRPRQTDIIKVKNTSQASRRKGEILKIEGKAITDISEESIWLLGVEPTANCYFGILKKPAFGDETTGDVVESQVSGACIALVDVTDVDHTRVDVVEGSFVLVSSDSGPLEILYQPGEIGEQECVVRFAGGGGSGPIIIRFQLVEPIFCEACTATGKVLSRPPGMATVPGEYGGNVNLADRLGCFLNEANAALIGRKGYAVRLTSEFPGPCPGLDETTYEITALCCAETQCDG